MRGTIASVLVVMLLCIVSPALSAAAEEELFDSKAAAAALETGLKLIKQKKYDAAVEAFDAAGLENGWLQEHDCE